jgi:hypothetical protein
MVKYLIKIPQKPLLPDITVWHVTEGDQEWLELSAGQHYWTWDSIDEFLDEVDPNVDPEDLRVRISLDSLEELTDELYRLVSFYRPTGAPGPGQGQLL